MDARHHETQVLAPEGRAVTLTDIAQEAGVSAVAVSVVLNKARSKVRVSPATRERIIEAAQRLQYRPNAVAQALRRQRTNIFAFYSAQRFLLDTSFPFYGALMSGLLQGCEEHQKQFLLHGTFRNLGEDEIFFELLNGQIDGLVLYTREFTPFIEKLVQSRLPVVTVVNEVPLVPCVGIENESGGRLMARHLAERGHRRILYRNPQKSLPATLQRRLNGFRSEAEAHNIEIIYSHCDEQFPNQEEQSIILSSNRPSAVVAYNDYLADGVVEFCRQNDLKVPTDIAVTGFDHLLSTLRPARALTTIHAPWAEVARHAVALLVARCNGEEVPLRTNLPVELVIGETT